MQPYWRIHPRAAFGVMPGPLSTAPPYSRARTRDVVSSRGKRVRAVEPATGQMELGL